MNHKLYAALIACLTVAGSRAAPPAKSFEWRREGESIALVDNDARVVWQFHYSAGLRKPMFHPVRIPGGPVLTADAPADHRWHHGFWFAWKYINGLNYWEERGGEKLGVTSWRDVEINTRSDHTATIRMVVDYHPADGPPILTERREVSISAPQESGQYVFDWQSDFTARDQSVVLDRTPIAGEPKGASWGGYAGLSWRFAQGLEDWKVQFANGDTALEPSGRRSSSLDVSVSSNGLEAGIAILEDSANPNFPTPWHIVAQPRNSFLFAQPAVLYYGPKTVAPRESFKLRYRVIVHAGRWDAERLNRAATQYTKGSVK